MSKWADVIEAQRRWADRIARTNGRFQHRAPAQPSPFLRSYFRALSALGKVLVSFGGWLQERYQPRSDTNDGRLPTER